MVFLSFNLCITSPEDIGDENDYDTANDTNSTGSLPLLYRWVVWQQFMSTGAKSSQYSESTQQIASCDTVEDFWRTWAQLPQPSELLTNRMALKLEGSMHFIDALMIFREGITPEWEDGANAEGGHFQFQLKGSLSGGQIDEHWNNLVLGVIGGTIEPAHIVTGIRLVDKLSGTRGSGNLRIEVWFSQFRDTEAVKLLQRNVERCIATRTLEGRIGVVPKAEIKNHKLTRHQ